MLIDSLKENELWSSFADVAYRVYKEKLQAPLKELERIRHIDQETDKVFVERAIRQAGLALTSEFFDLNRDKLTNAFYELIRFWEVDGSPNYPKFISFLLGRSFSEDVLYSNDDVSLTTEHGRLIINGGDWFATSHVDISVDARGLRESLVLRITNDDIKSVRKALGYETEDEAGKNSIDQTIKDLQQRDLDTEADDTRIVKAVMENRILSVYYQFAPIEKVVNSIYMVMSAEATIRIFGSSLARPKVYAQPGKPKPITYRMTIPRMVQGVRLYDAKVLVTLDNGAQLSRYPTAVDGDHIESFDGRIVVFKDVDFTLNDIDYTFTMDGIIHLRTVDLYSIDTPFVPDSIWITGTSTPNDGATSEYHLVAQYDNLREEADPDRVTWTIDSELGSFSDNVLTIAETFEEESAVVTATHRNVDGTESVATLNVTITPSERNLMPKRIDFKLEHQDNGSWVELDPGSEIVQGMTGVYITPVVVYTDNSEKELYSLPAQLRSSEELTIPLWEVSTSATGISEEGELEIPVVYRDFTAAFTAIYQEGDRVVQNSVTVLFKKPRLVVDSIEIIGSGSVLEETRTVYQLLATWSNGQTSVVEADWTGSHTALASAGRISETGILTAPSVDLESTKVNINASIEVYRYDANDEESIIRLATSKVITVNALRREIDRMEVLTPQGLSQGNSNRVRFYADWNDDTNTQIIPHRVEVIKDSVIISKYVRQTDGSGVVSDTFDHVANNPVILTTIADDSFRAVEDDQNHQQFSLEYLLDEDDSSTLDTVTGLIELKVFYINPLDEVDHGSYVEMTDTWLDSVNDVPYSSYTMNISVVPKIFLSESLEIVYSESMGEGNRVFLTALVTYANGETEQAQAVWSIEPVYVDQEIEADLTQGVFTLERIVEVLIGVDRSWLDSNTLTDAMVSNLIDGELIFKSIAETSPPDWTNTVRTLIDSDPEREYPRALVQTRNLEDESEPQQFKINARYFQQDETVTITNVPNPVIAYDLINSSRVEGPGEIYSDTTLYYSYGLVVDYDDLGISYMTSSGWTVDVRNKSEVLQTLVDTNATYISLLPVKSDLSIYTVPELSDEQLEEVFQSIQIAEIDTNGYLYPRINVEAELLVTASYDDGITVFEKNMEVYMKQTNSILVGMFLYNITNDGQFQRTTNVTPSDSTNAGKVIRLSDAVTGVEGNPDEFGLIDGISGKLYYRFRALVERTDDLGTYYNPEVVTWSLETASDKVSLMQPNANVIGLIVDKVEEDVQVIIRGVYSEEFARTSDSTNVLNPLAGEDRVETVSTSIRVIIESSTAIDEIERTGVDYAYDDSNAVFVPTVRVARRDGTFVTDVSDMVTWYIVSGPIGLVFNEDRTGLIIPTLTSSSSMVLRAVATEGLRTIQKDFEYDLLMQFTPSSIEISLPQTNQDAMIDAGSYELGASLTGTTAGGPETRDISDSAFYYFNYVEDDASFEDNILEINPVFEDKEITVTVKSRDYPTFYDTKTLRVYSSYPVYGTYLDGVNNSALFQTRVDNEEFIKHYSRSGGTITLDPNADEYGYFAHPKHLGIATFTYIPIANSATSIIGGWDGASAGSGPITVTRTYETGLTEEWYLYRTNLRGFAAGKFAVSYTAE